MKNLNYLVSLMFAVVLMTASCSKDDVVTPEVPQGITTSDLTGNWDFVSLEFNGNTTYGCDAELNADYDLVTLSLKNVTASNMTLSALCDESPDFNRTYSLKNDVITIENGFMFEITNAKTFNGSVLKLKLINQGILTTLPLNGIYTLNKQ
jgi:hypothetical protein